MAAIFSIVPIEVWRDKRLTLEQMRVLGVLFSFRGKNTDTVWPSRQQIAERCGMNLCNISTATTALERLGWLRKDGKGGHSKATRYTITVPDICDGKTVAHSATVADQATVAPSATRLPVAHSATRKEHTSEHTSTRSRVTSPKFDARIHLTGLGISDDLIGDWLTLRKQKRAAVTKTAIDGIQREASKAGIPLVDALRMCCERGWQGFNASWLQDSKSGAPQPQPNIFQGAI